VHGEKNHECQICGYKCSRKTSLKIHNENVHVKKKLFLCLHCDYKCNWKSQFKKHVETAHEQKKSHNCLFCDYRSHAKPDMKRHIESVHEKKKPYRLVWWWLWNFIVRRMSFNGFCIPMSLLKGFSYTL